MSSPADKAPSTDAEDAEPVLWTPEAQCSSEFSGHHLFRCVLPEGHTGPHHYKGTVR